MAAFFRFVASLLAHVAWQRAGKRGPLPAVKIPGKRTTRLPVPSPWQIMIASWILERLWHAYGDEVKQKLTHTKSPLVNRAAQHIPVPSKAKNANTSTNTGANANANSGIQPSQPATATAPNAAPAPAGRPAARSYATRPLPDSGPQTGSQAKSPSGPLPAGSVLKSLRRS